MVKASSGPTDALPRINQSCGYVADTSLDRRHSSCNDERTVKGTDTFAACDNVPALPPLSRRHFVTLRTFKRGRHLASLF